jgi:hypothetical protein
MLCFGQFASGRNGHRKWLWNQHIWLIPGGRAKPRFCPADDGRGQDDRTARLKGKHPAGVLLTVLERDSEAVMRAQR